MKKQQIKQAINVVKSLVNNNALSIEQHEKVVEVLVTLRNELAKADQK